jgi:hypothetical protein
MTTTSSRTDTGLVRIVPAQAGECVSGIAAGVVADVVVLLSTDDLGLSGGTGRIQVICLAVTMLLWTLNLVLSRRRELRAFDSAVPIPLPTAPQDRLLRQGYARTATHAVVTTLLSACLLHLPLVGVAFQLSLLLSLVHAWRTAGQWERRHGAALWKPAVSAVGRRAWRESPYFVTGKPS